MVYINIVIFGGCYCSEDYYNKVYEFVKNKLNNINYTVITGGTIGTMEAISKATRENNVKSIGIVLDKWQEYINKYVDEIKLFDNELDRLTYMIKNGDVFICLDGDIGTLTELFTSWLYVMDEDKKLYITGEKIRESLEYMYSNGTMDVDSKKHINFISLDDLEI